MFERLPEITRRWRSGSLSDAVYAGHYFLLWLFELHGKRFASRRDRREAVPDLHTWLSVLDGASGDAGVLLADYLSRYQFNGITANVPQALGAWLRGEWALSLCEYIPKPRQVLLMQAAGVRPVTILSDPERMGKPVLKKPNAFAFMVHDLEHAYKFFHDGELHAGQLRFFKQLLEAVQTDTFDALHGDAVFQEKFEYLMSDMNTHVMHSLQYLRAILIEGMLRLEGKTPAHTLSPFGDARVERMMSPLMPVLEPGDFSRLPAERNLPRGRSVETVSPSVVDALVRT